MIDAEFVASRSLGNRRSLKTGHQMFDYLKKKYGELLASVLDPIFNWLLGLSWPRRAALILVVPLVWTIWDTRMQISEHLLVLNQARRVLVSAPGTIPISEELRDQLARLGDRLQTASATDVALISPPELTGWSAAQSAIATAGDIRLVAARSSFIEYMRKRRIDSCGCWAELNQDGAEKAWIFISGWALAALAIDRNAASPQEIAFILGSQRPNGAWLPTTDALQEFSSVYTTAWSIIGLRAQLDAKLLDKDTSDRAAVAISRGASWLLSTRQPGARWKPYPMLLSSNASPTISGLALHALKRASTSNIVDLQQEWLKSLPATPIPTSIGENFYVEIRSQSGVTNIDHFVQITLPWMLIATTDAFDGGSIMQRARAIRWLESQIRSTGLMNSDTETKHWWRAEMSIAVNHLAHGIAPNAGGRSTSAP